MRNVEDKPRQKNKRIWYKLGKNPNMGKTLEQFFLLFKSNVQHRERERADRNIIDLPR